MHDEAFADAARPAPCIILRLPMRPYSLGHELLLLRKRNPLIRLPFEEFAILPETERRRALIEAVLLCSRTWRENERPHRWLNLWGWFIAGFEVIYAVHAFHHYRNAGMLVPPRPAPEVDSLKSGRTPGAPILATLYLFIMNLPAAELRLHGDTAWDFPFGHAFYLFTSEMESQGRMHIENSDDIAAVKYAAQLEQEILAEQAGRKPQEAACQV